MNFYKKILELEAQGEPVVLCTIVSSKGSTPRRTGSKMLVYSDGATEGTIGGGEMESLVIDVALQSLFGSGKPDLLSYSFVDPQRGDPGVCGGSMEVYVEPILPQPSVLIFGAGHVGRALAELAQWLGVYVILADDREEIIGDFKESDADEIHLLPAEELAEKITIHSRTAVVLTTRGVALDVASLPAILKTPAAYIGVIGSRRRWQTALKKLQEAGVSDADLARIVSPIGLEINAETPEEIALSVMAEITMLRQGGDGKRMGV